MDLARVFKALGDPTRLAIFELIREGANPAQSHSPKELENSISRIAAQFDLSLSTVSHHSKELRERVSCAASGAVRASTARSSQTSSSTSGAT